MISRTSVGDKRPTTQRHIHRYIVHEESDLRAKNQVTVPKEIAQFMGLQPGDRLVFVIEQGDPDRALLYRMPRSFAGVAPHAYGGPLGTASYLEAERQDWDD